MFKRVALFVLTNLAVLVVINVSLRLLGVDQMLTNNGIDFGALLVFSAVVGFAGAFVSLAISKWMAKMSTGAVVITQPTNPTERWLLDTVARQAKAAGIGMPEVAVYDSPEINAFATGMNRNNALVAVSSGLLQQMSRDEAEAVLAHEVSHVANGDMVTMALIQGVVNTFVVFLARIVGYVVDRVLLKNEQRGIGYFVTVLVAEVVFSILASVVVMYFSRRREFAADRGAAHLAGAPKMVAALKRLQTAHEESQLPQQVAAFGIQGRSSWSRLFMSHPPLEERISALQTHQQ